MSMSTGVMTERLRAASPRSKARIAGVFYLLAVLTAGCGELILHGGLDVAAGLIAVSCFAVVTLVLYDLFRPVSRGIALVAASSNLVGLTFEALRWDPHGVDVAMGFHGLYCLLIGYLVFKSIFLPRILGALMALAGLAWVTILLPPVALSPYHVVLGFFGEASLMLWLLVMGVNVERWKEQASAVGRATSI